MATLQVTIKDATLAAALATMPGADDTERLAALKVFVKTQIRDRVRFDLERAAITATNVTLQATLAAINAGLAEA